ncbi:MAG: hypothetical protein PWP63_1340 [Methanolobus sp.]|jgi:hypothetical protein|nr:hypothetical protein [Methanolobus sp.]
MYTCIKDPETGRNLYANIEIETKTMVYPKSGTSDTTITRVETTDVVTEAEFSEVIAWELRGAIIRSGPLLSWVVKEVFGISVETCPELIAAVEEKLNEARLDEMVL